MRDKAQKSPSKHNDLDSNDLASERTDLAEDRNIMAMECTFAGWMRTSFAAIGIGLAFRAVFGEFDPSWLARAIATAFTAERRACRTFNRLAAHQLHAPEIPSIRWLGWGVTAGAILLAISLWFLHEAETLGGG